MSETQNTPLDGNFYKRADDHITLANGHISEKITPADTTNSLMFASSRFNAWIAAAGFKSSEEMQKEKQEILDFFTTQYRHMLEENFNNYIDNFEQFMRAFKEMSEKQ